MIIGNVKAYGLHCIPQILNGVVIKDVAQRLQEIGGARSLVASGLVVELQ